MSRRRRVQGWALTRDLLVAGIGVLFSMWVTFAQGYHTVYQAFVAILAGLILYVFVNARRQRLGLAVEPTEFVELDGAAADGDGGVGFATLATALADATRSKN